MKPPSSGSADSPVVLHAQGDDLELALAGDWRLTRVQPSWRALAPAPAFKRVRIRADQVGAWDTSIILFVVAVQQDCAARKVPCDLSALPEKMRALIGQLDGAQGRIAPAVRTESFLAAVGNAATGLWPEARVILRFIGECVIGLSHGLKRPRRFRWTDCFDEMQQCGAMALPIVGLIGFLVGLTLAYQAAVELRQFGADIYVADLIGLSIVREMGPMMAAVIVAGRTGAAFAASLANMKMNEEIDALEVLGIPPVDFLVMPRLIALGVMMPLLALYANAVGILGGVVVASGILQIPPTAYWVETRSIVDLSDVSSGLIKAAVFGILIGVSGCLRGLQAERSAAGVGRAATSAVVTAILLIIVADAVFAVLFHVLGI